MASAPRRRRVGKTNTFTEAGLLDRLVPLILADQELRVILVSIPGKCVLTGSGNPFHAGRDTQVGGSIEPLIGLANEQLPANACVRRESPSVSIRLRKEKLAVADAAVARILALQRIVVALEDLLKLK